ncbi:RNA-directed DNA polymerase, eukaryota [Tanacetum coccineum]
MELRSCDEIMMGMLRMRWSLTSKIINKIHQVNIFKLRIIAQKAKIKWAIEGDENVKFFHGMLNKKRNQSNIRGIMVNGTWVDDPVQVKREFFEHFRGRFDKPSVNRACIDTPFPVSLSIDQKEDMERRISKEEVKRAVWDCGVDKSPGPDGFSFSFYRHFWPVIEKDVFEAVDYFFMYVGVLGDLVNEVQSAFVADRQILDGPFILDEVLQWCRRKKKHALIFKVDFEKAFDSVRWDFVDDVLNKFGFGERWRTWIQSCLRSSRGSILVNELAYFFSTCGRCGFWGGCLFTGIKINSMVNLSHLFYADDAIFLGQWSELNIDSLVRVLDCFFRASGLRINMCKSKIMGVNVEDGMVKNAASKLGCLVLKTPFTYLGTKVGGNMSRKQAWKEVVDKVLSRLSRWKMKLLSIGGRLTLLKSVRFFHGQDPSSILRNVPFGLKWIKAYLWVRTRILNKDVSGWNYIRLKLGNGENTRFWLDNWYEGGVIKELFPQSERVELRRCQLNSLAGFSRMDYSRALRKDRYVLTLESDGVFSVAYIRRRLMGIGFRSLVCPNQVGSIRAFKIKRLRRQETPRIVGDDSARSEPTEVADSNNFKPLLKEKRLKEQTEKNMPRNPLRREDVDVYISIAPAFFRRSQKELYTWFFINGGSVIHSPRMLSPLILERWRLLLIIPWKKCEFKSPSTAHRILALCLRSFTLHCSKLARSLTEEFLSSTSEGERKDDSALLSKPLILLRSSRKATVNLVVV